MEDPQQQCCIMEGEEDCDAFRHQYYSWRSELWHQIQTVLPTLASMTLNKIPYMISLRFVGSLGSAEYVAAAALATTLFNVTGLSLSVGLSSALTTLTGQSRGDLQQRHQQLKTIPSPHVSSDRVAAASGKIEREGLLQKDTPVVIHFKDSENTHPRQHLLMPLVYLYRGMFVQLAFVLPVGLYWLLGDTASALRGLGQGDELSQLTAAYLRILAPGLWAYSLNWTMTAWLQALELAHVPAGAAAVGLVLHGPVNYWLVSYLDGGYLGCATATVVYQVLQPVLLLCYLAVVGRGRVLRQTHCLDRRREVLFVIGEVREAITSVAGLLQYCGLALPGILLISEWWASEVMIFLSGNLKPSPDVALGGMTIYQTINSFCFMFPVAFAIAGSARVGTLLGAGQAAHASFAGKVSVLCAGIASAGLGCLLYFSPHTWIPGLFAPSEKELQEQAASTIPLLAVYVFADGVQSALNGIIKGCGKQAATMPIVLIAYWVIAVPLGYFLAFVRYDGRMECDEGYFCGILALVAGATTGTVVHMSLLLMVVFCFTDFDAEVEKATGRVRTKARCSEEDSASMVELS